MSSSSTVDELIFTLIFPVSRYLRASLSLSSNLVGKNPQKQLYPKTDEYDLGFLPSDTLQMITNISSLNYNLCCSQRPPTK